jgi:hypothetical protein
MTSVFGKAKMKMLFHPKIGNQAVMPDVSLS